MSDFQHKNTDKTLITDESDLDFIRKYTEAYNKAYAEGDKAGQQAAHDAAEKIRAKYDYSTSWLDKLGDSNYNYDQSGQISAKLDALLNRTPFSYDAASDPLYQQYRKQYTREADRSAEDVLGKAAVMTGGMPSTAAVAASQQASDYQMSQMTDKIPELQQLAYSMYQDKLSGDRADLNTLIGIEDNNYNRWLADRNYLYQLARDQVGDQQTADALAYQKQQDKMNYDYQKERDAIEDARYDAEWQYKLQQAAQAAAQSGTRRSNNVTAPPREADYDGLFEAAYQSGYPQSYIANNYKKFGLSSASGAYDGYKTWLENQNGSGDETPAPSGDLSKLGYDPDEGIFTWGGNRYRDLQSLIDTMNSANLTSAEKTAIQKKMKSAGFTISF